MDESLMGQNITCPNCAKEFFATPLAPAPAKVEVQTPHLSLLDKTPFFKGHRRQMLEEKFDELLSLGPIDEDAVKNLVSFAVSINLQASDVIDLRREKFLAEFEPIKRRVETSMWLTDDDLAAQADLEKKYGVSADLTSGGAICREIFLLESKGELPAPITTDLMLDAKEIAYYCATTTWHQSRVQSSGYAGGSVSVPTGISGVRLRFGRYTPIKSEVMTPLASGSLYVTSKRLLFNGDARNTTITLRKIVDGHAYSDALEIEKTTGKPDLFSMSAACGRLVLALIGKLK